MTIKYVAGNIIDLIHDADKANEKIIVPHIVNSHGIMGSGVAKALYDAFPIVKSQYVHFFKTDPGFDLGEVQFVQCKENIRVANMIAQKFGTKIINGETIPPIRYWALKECMKIVKDHLQRWPQYRIIAPEFGSLRAGGDFTGVIIPMINNIWDNLDVTICTYK